METKRVDLANGQWAEFYLELKHRTAKAVADLSRPYLTFPGGSSTIKVSQGKDGDLKAVGNAKEIIVDIGKMDFNAQNEAIILNQVKEWSYGEVTAEVIGELSEKEFDQLKEIANDLYKQGPLAESAGEN